MTLGELSTKSQLISRNAASHTQTLSSSETVSIQSKQRRHRRTSDVVPVFDFIQSSSTLTKNELIKIRGKACGKMGLKVGWCSSEYS